MGVEDVVAQQAAAAWGDFLSNRLHEAETRASRWISLLQQRLQQAGVQQRRQQLDTLVALADLAYIAGAAKADDATLRLALRAYDAYLSSRRSSSALKMRAETLLRLRQYEDAFDAFDAVHAQTLALLAWQLGRAGAVCGSRCRLKIPTARKLATRRSLHARHTVATAHRSECVRDTCTSEAGSLPAECAAIDGGAGDGEVGSGKAGNKACSRAGEGVGAYEAVNVRGAVLGKRGSSSEGGTREMGGGKGVGEHVDKGGGEGGGESGGESSGESGGESDEAEAEAESEALQLWESSVVAPFKLVHDAECLEDAVASGASHDLLKRAHAWRELAAQLALPEVRQPSISSSADAESASEHARIERRQASSAGKTDATRGSDSTQVNDAGQLRRVPLSSLSAAQRVLLGSDYGQPLPPPPVAMPSGSRWQRGSQVLRTRDWRAFEAQYAAERLLVIDDLFTDDALSELQAYTQHGAHFRTVRNGYLGAMPSDGLAHPLLLQLLRELNAAAPAVFGPHALGLWWLFKYGASRPQGIGLHADPAAVNLNVWLTPDKHRISGGGLVVYNYVPPFEQPTGAINHEFDSERAEEALRRSLLTHGEATRVPYRCNRACVFVSDQYHESESFEFEAGYRNRRVNLTMLFGDRRNVRAGVKGNDIRAGQDEHQLQISSTDVIAQAESSATAAAAAASAGWDVFD